MQKNAPEVEISIVGAGTSVPVVDHSPAGIFLKCGSFSALMDIGPGTLSRLPGHGVNAFDLENIFITHLHPDHVLDLAMFFQMTNYSMDHRKEIPLDIFCCSGCHKFLDDLMRLFPDIEKPSFEVRIHEMGKDGLEKNGVMISSIHSAHTSNSLAFKVDFGHVRLVYTGDCKKTGELSRFCRDASVLISECSFPDEWPTSDHMNAKDLGRLASSAKVGQLVVVHQYPPALEMDIGSQISQHYSGPVLIARDGTRVYVNAPSGVEK